MTNVTREDIARGLRALGLASGDKLIVHSSLKSFGHVEGGANAVIGAIQDVVTERGTIVMPSFNHAEIYEEGGEFDVRSTPTSNGAVAEAFRNTKGVFRSVNPTHAFAAWGADAKRYTDGHQQADALGEGSALDMLYKEGGYALLLGVDYTANTFHHYVETVTHTPCLLPRGEEYPMIGWDGERFMAHTWSWREEECPIDDFGRYAEEMKPFEHVGRIGDCKATFFALADAFRVIAKCLREGYAGFPPCAKCAIRPQVCEWTVKR